MFRVGTGFDVHQLVSGRPLVLGGVTIPHPKGLLGHSDADVLIHAVMDALLGAAALGDLGAHFPPSDPKWKGADSRELLRQVGALLQKAGWQPGNIDATVLAEQPKLAPHIPAMRAHLAQDLGLPLDAVSVKATTTEKLGFVGREEGMAAEAAVLIHSR